MTTGKLPITPNPSPTGAGEGRCCISLYDTVPANRATSPREGAEEELLKVANATKIVSRLLCLFVAIPHL